MARESFPARMRLWERRLFHRWAIWTMIAGIITYPKRHAATIQLAADQRQLELEVLMGRVSDEELKQRVHALTERYNAITAQEGGGDGA